jgi:guanosine-3',5'-bis(diphosphate) 3'-pyrophosphohydrolase
MFNLDEVNLFMVALQFAATKHRHQRRKDREETPYINHPLAVVQVLWEGGGMTDMVMLIGALLHDTLEDTDATPAEIEQHFGSDILELVQEVTDDKSLPKSERKRLQIERAPYHSICAKQIKLADKICNVYDLIHSTPKDWSLQRCIDYLDWSEQVVAGLRGANFTLEVRYDGVLAEARKHFQENEKPS